MLLKLKTLLETKMKTILHTIMNARIAAVVLAIFLAFSLSACTTYDRGSSVSDTWDKSDSQPSNNRGSRGY